MNCVLTARKKYLWKPESFIISMLSSATIGFCQNVRLWLASRARSPSAEVSGSALRIALMRRLATKEHRSPWEERSTRKVVLSSDTSGVG